MNPAVTLTITDELGRTREFVVDSKRLTIGRTPENDLVIENTSLSRRHAVIENFDGVVQISDCGSQNGTEVNGAAVSVGTVLFDGDVIRLGGVCEIEVAIRDETEVAQATTPTPVTTAEPQAVIAASDMQSRTTQGPSQSWLDIPAAHLMMAAAGVLVILGAAGVLIFLIAGAGKQQRVKDRPTANNDTVNQSVTNADEDANTSASPDATSEVVTGRADASARQIENAAAGVIRRISSDDKTYAFNDKALQDITRKVGQFRTSSSLNGNLVAIQRNSSSLGALARQDGIEPGLLIYLLLAEAEASHQSIDPKSGAAGVASDLLALRATFGTNDADGSLLVIAAYKMGRGEKRSHPLLATIRRLVKNPLTQRNVWYLNEHGGLEPQVYDFVVSIIALGVIAQEPGQFGLTAQPLVF